MTTDSPLLPIDKSTLVPLGLLVAVVLAAVGGTWQLASTINTFTRDQSMRDKEFALKFQRIELQLQQVQTGVDSVNGDRFRRADMREWIALFKANNSTLTIPDIPK